MDCCRNTILVEWDRDDLLDDALRMLPILLIHLQYGDDVEVKVEDLQAHSCLPQYAFRYFPLYPPNTVLFIDRVSIEKNLCNQTLLVIQMSNTSDQISPAILAVLFYCITFWFSLGNCNFKSITRIDV